MHTNYYNDISRLSKTRESEKAAATRRGAMSWQLAAIGQAQKQQQQQQQQPREETTTANNDDIARHKAKSQMTGNVSLSLT